MSGEVESAGERTARSRRFATIDLGTNTALLLVAEREQGRFKAILERAEITRLGQGVDETRLLRPEAMRRSAEALAEYARLAADLGVEPKDIAAVTTSAARDAQNSDELIALVRDLAGIELEIIPGETEAALTYAGATADLDVSESAPLAVFDIGGGSSELIYGTRTRHDFRHSFDVGSVRLTERFLRSDPPTPEEARALSDHLESLFAVAPKPHSPVTFVGVAGTVTTLFTILHAIEPYETARVHRQRMGLQELRGLREKLFSLTVAERRALKGIEPKRADVIAAGAAILEAAMAHVGARELTVSDRGLRWGLITARFGQTENNEQRVSVHA